MEIVLTTAESLQQIRVNIAATCLAELLRQFCLHRQIHDYKGEELVDKKRGRATQWPDQFLLIDPPMRTKNVFRPHKLDDTRHHRASADKTSELLKSYGVSVCCPSTHTGQKSNRAREEHPACGGRDYARHEIT